MKTPPVAFQKPEDLIVALIRAGWRQDAIADAVGASQPSISRILSGAHKDPGYQLVDKLRRLVLELEHLTA